MKGVIVNIFSAFLSFNSVKLFYQKSSCGFCQKNPRKIQIV